MKSIPQIKKYTTTVPKSIGHDQPLSKSREFMNELRMRHLPVLRAGKLIGVLTDRDINLVIQFNDVDPSTLKVEEACSFDPYFTSPEAPLNDVVKHMADKKMAAP